MSEYKDSSHRDSGLLKTWGRNGSDTDICTPIPRPDSQPVHRPKNFNDPVSRDIIHGTRNHTVSIVQCEALRLFLNGWTFRTWSFRCRGSCTVTMMLSSVLFEVFRFRGGHAVGVLREAKRYNGGFAEGIIYSGDVLRLNYLGQ